MDALPPDPYAALGVAKDATTAHIKQQYRKLVLKLHPDKVQDDGLKQAAADQFHKVQSAYEIVSDEDRRQRYDAQCKLEQLRRDAMQRGGRGGTDVRTAGFRMPTESARGGEFYARGPERSGRMSPQFEERAPRDDYFDAYAPPRPTSRKDNDFERSSKRAPPREDPKKSKTSSKKSKESERSAREDRSRRSDQDVRKERDRKNAYAFQQSPTSDSDEYDRARRQREDDDFRRAAEDDMRRRRDEEEAAASVFGDRARKYFDQEYQARAYQAGNGTSPQERSPPRERRPSPTRNNSSRENVEYVKRKDGKPPVMIRRGSGRPETSREPRKTTSREKSFEIVDEPEEISPTSRRPPTLNKTNSSPADIRPPFERQRSSSLQFDPRDPPPMPSIKRAETMPYPQTSSERRGKESSKLRTQVPQDAYPTPETSPEPPTPRRGSSGRNLTDEDDYRMPESYRTEFREPASPRERQFTRSPPPMDDYPERREKSRPSSSKHPAMPSMKRTTSTQYQYSSPAEPTDNPRRPSLQREGSSRLFGEIPRDQEPTIRSPKPPTSKSSRYAPPQSDISYSQNIRPENIRMTTGNYNVRRGGSERRQTPVHAR